MKNLNFKQELQEILNDKDHEVRKQYKTCDCECPLSNTIIPILFQHICIRFEVPEEMKNKGLEFWTKLNQISCAVIQGKNRIYVASALFYISAILTGNKQYTQEFIRQNIGIPPITIRNIYKPMCEVLSI